MTSITKATVDDFKLLSDIGRTSFIESHGIGASDDIIETYVSQNYTCDIFKEELSDPKNIYHIIYRNGKPAGFSKIVFDSPHSNIQMTNVTKLDRLYLLKEFYNLKLGFELFNFNVELSKQYNQSGMWLYVWIENQRAISFYERTGFKIIGSYDFKLTETHSNPNHQMVKVY